MLNWDVLTKIRVVNSRLRTLDEYVNNQDDVRMQVNPNLSKQKVIFQGYPAYRIIETCDGIEGLCMGQDYYVIHKEGTNLFFEISFAQVGYNDGPLHGIDITFKFTD